MNPRVYTNLYFSSGIYALCFMLHAFEILVKRVGLKPIFFRHEGLTSFLVLLITLSVKKSQEENP